MDPGHDMAHQRYPLPARPSIPGCLFFNLCNLDHVPTNWLQPPAFTTVYHARLLNAKRTEKINCQRVMFIFWNSPCWKENHLEAFIVAFNASLEGCIASGVGVVSLQPSTPFLGEFPPEAEIASFRKHFHIYEVKLGRSLYSNTNSFVCMNNGLHWLAAFGLSRLFFAYLSLTPWFTYRNFFHLVYSDVYSFKSCFTCAYFMTSENIPGNVIISWGKLIMADSLWVSLSWNLWPFSRFLPSRDFQFLFRWFKLGTLSALHLLENESCSFGLAALKIFF